MTGQGSKQFEQIATSKAFAMTEPDVSKNYRTANGCAVRGLRAVRTNKAVVGGRVVTVAHSYFIITGQVKVKHGWQDADWNADGKHPQEQYSLVEVKEAQAQQVNLF